MSTFYTFFEHDESSLPACAVFMSGSGTNAEKLIEYQLAQSEKAYEISVLVTDAPESSRAREIGDKYGIPVVALDIRAFYKSHGLDTISLKTEEGQRVRELWTGELRQLLADYRIDFALLAGFVPLTNITSDFPCLNVHPGDLTYVEDGERVFIGLHALPVEKALLEEMEVLRSSVILAEPYTDKGGNMDSGLIIGLSSEVNVDLLGYSYDELKACKQQRAGKKPKEGWGDALAEVAGHNLRRLKEFGDWTVFPRVADDFARGKFLKNEEGALFYKMSRTIPVETVVYGTDYKEIIFSIN